MICSKEERNPEPNPAVRAAFTQEIAKSNQRADAVLAHSPDDRDALLAKVLNLGLEADYLAMVEKRNMAAVSTSKKASELAEKLLRAAPDCYDAYLAIGVENYLLGLQARAGALVPAPVRRAHRQGRRHPQARADRGKGTLPAALRAADAGCGRAARQ